jgi:hypothetical protein
MRSVDIGFFRKGRPFFPFGGSCSAGAMAGGAGSVASLVPTGRLAPLFGLELYRSVGVTNDEAGLVCFTGTGGGRFDGLAFVDGSCCLWRDNTAS